MLCGNNEGTDSPVLFSNIHFFVLKLFSLLAHALGDKSHLASLVGEGIGLIFFLLYFLGKLSVLLVFLVDASSHLLNHVKVVSDILLDLFSKDIEIEHAVSEGVKEMRLMGNN